MFEKELEVIVKDSSAFYYQDSGLLCCGIRRICKTTRDSYYTKARQETMQQAQINFLRHDFQFVISSVSEVPFDVAKVLLSRAKNADKYKVATNENGWIIGRWEVVNEAKDPSISSSGYHQELQNNPECSRIRASISYHTPSIISAAGRTDQDYIKSLTTKSEWTEKYTRLIAPAYNNPNTGAEIQIVAFMKGACVVKPLFDG